MKAEEYIQLASLLREYEDELRRIHETYEETKMKAPEDIPHLRKCCEALLENLP